ncbi:pilus assembly protein TadG-related protein [Roseibacterium beibuensis]|uniref:TadE/TadG family type IV pilus assembly protein n=1 Tax=[Roseibacterium] beibuensis TaxID=1193142 RepID=UPI00217E3BD9|nr:pilus assembly protein TadG-related protein [Roseibacterium beibuensis]MCS6625282.1 pilus assembly protein TadG-related protein [Roseibacterium beibuensis]
MRIISWARRFGRDNRGSIALKAALVLPAVLMMGAGAFDLTQVQASRIRLQDIADSAALAAANDLALATDGSNAVERARAYVDTHLREWDQAPEVESVYEVVDIDGQRAIQVRLRGHRPSFFANLLPPGGWNFNARSTATTMGMVPLCVLITGDTSSKVLNVKDSSQMNAPACLVHSNRDIVVEGGSITAGAAQAVTSASGFISPTAGTGAAMIADPFSRLDLNQRHNLLCSVADLLRPLIVSSGTHYVDAGKHCGGIKASGTARIILSSGDHLFLGGHLIISEGARLEGQDVVLFFDKASKFEFKDQAVVNLDGRKSGQFAGMVMGGTRDNTQDFIISADHVEALLGVIYVPSAKLIVEGTEDVARDSAWTVIVAKELQMKGSPSLFINANYDASDVPVPAGVGPRAGGSRLID